MSTAELARTIRPTMARLIFVALALATSLALAGILASALAAGGLSFLELGLISLHGVLVLWLAANFWLSLFGALRLAWQEHQARSKPISANDRLVRHLGAPPRTAIVIPVYNENPAEVFARLRAIYRCLEHSGGLAAFDFFVLSDTRDPDIWLAEELEWLESCRDLNADGRIFYRRRSDNYERKPGNIRDFLERWGRHYRYMVVLDADSLLDGGTLREMVGRMERDPGLALLQTRPKLINGKTLFARCQQFAGSLYGEPVIAGLAWLLGDAGNYWGHNAIIRVHAFMESCGLPTLPKRGAREEEILSHDFVEAALLGRAGWKVRIAHDLSGSYEEGPPDVVEHINRDRRWCRGNMQHLRLIGASGFKPLSRINLLTGVLAYASAPLWLLFIATALLIAASAGTGDTAGSAGATIRMGGVQPAASVEGGLLLTVLLPATIVLLLAPKLFGFLCALTSRTTRNAYGGVAKAGASVILETILSTLWAPMVLVHHARFVTVSLIKGGTAWGVQRRQAMGVTWGDAWRVCRSPLGLCGFVAAGLIWASPWALVWLSPILLGVLLGLPLAVYSSREDLGQALRRAGLLVVPEESNERPTVLRLFDDESRRSRSQESTCIYRHLFLDPHFNAAHCALYQRQRHASSTPALRELHELWMRGPEKMALEEKVRALSDIGNLRRMHAEIWASQRDFGPAQPTRPAAV